MLIPLPSIISSALAASSPWPIQTARPPLHYEPLDQMAVIRKKEQEAGNSKPVLPPSPIEVLSEVSSTCENSKLPFLKVALGLLYLSRQGYADECHDLITPLSWSGDTHFSYGAPQPSTEAEAVATYAHCLLHRYEGSNMGEFGMMGYSNANFWGKSTMARDKSALPLNDIRSAVQSLFASEVVPLSNKAREAGREWFQEWIQKDMPDGGWEPRTLNELCKTSEMKKCSDALAEFAAHAAQAECDVLVRYCLEKAGYDVPKQQLTAVFTAVDTRGKESLLKDMET